MSESGITDPARLLGLPSIIATDRLGTYLRACAGDAGGAIRLYSWNIEAAAAMWGPLHVLEVAVRNAIHRELTVHADREDWWERVRLSYPQRDQIEAARRVAKINHGSAVKVGHSVAELSLGFWTALLANRYHARLWIPALQRAFPYRPRPVRRGDIHARLESLRLLRNRIAHHEPIFAHPLDRAHEDILAVLGYLNPDGREWVIGHSRGSSRCWSAERGACSAPCPHRSDRRRLVRRDRHHRAPDSRPVCWRH